MSSIEDVGDPPIVEPVSLTETKEYLGYASKATADDSFIQREITAMRSLLERRMGRAIVLRQMRMRVADPDGPYALIPELQSVDRLYCTVKDAAGKETVIDIEDFEPDYIDAAVDARFPLDAKKMTIEFTAGYPTVPAEIRSAILDMVRMRFERSAEDPVAAVRAQTQPYWVEHL